jgi:hypothetical protein
MATFKVISAVKTGSYESEYGEEVDGKKVMFKYAVELEGLSTGVELSQKPSTTPPKAGDTLNGTIESTKYGQKFKKESGGGYSGGRGGSAPETVRQTALKAAAGVYQGQAVAAKVVLEMAGEFKQWLEVESVKEVFGGDMEPSPAELSKSDAAADQLDV